MKIRAKFIKDAVAHYADGPVTIPAGEIADLSPASFNRWHRRGCVEAIECIDDKPAKAGRSTKAGEAGIGKDGNAGREGEAGGTVGGGKVEGAGKAEGIDAKGGNPG